MIQKGDILYAGGNNQRVLLFARTTVSMEVNPRMEVTFIEVEFHVNKLS